MANIGRLVVITGPSGVGKSTIVHEVLRRTGAFYSVSATTRAARPGEVAGRDYLFVSRPEFEKMIAEEELLEWAEVFGDYYGTPEGPVREALADGKVVILEIDVQGGLQVHQKMPAATFLLVLPPGEAELRRRLTGRGTEPVEALERRIAKARDEIRLAEAGGIYIHKVVNDDLDRAVRQVVEITNKEQTQE